MREREFPYQCRRPAGLPEHSPFHPFRSSWQPSSADHSRHRTWEGHASSDKTDAVFVSRDSSRGRSGSALHSPCHRPIRSGGARPDRGQFIAAPLPFPFDRFRRPLDLAKVAGRQVQLQNFPRLSPDNVQIGRSFKLFKISAIAVRRAAKDRTESRSTSTPYSCSSSFGIDLVPRDPEPDRSEIAPYQAGSR